MPTYSFVNTKTNEEWDDMMSMSEKETYLKDNPHIKSIITQVNIVAGTGGIRNDSGWNENMQRIAEAHPTSEIANKLFFSKKLYKESTSPYLEKL